MRIPIVRLTQKWYSTLRSPGDETGNRSGLKIRCSQELVGSTPTPGTMTRSRLPKQELLCWSPELAYAVGLLVTDGNLSRDGRHMSMRSSDRQLLKVFRECLGLSNTIAITGDHRRTDAIRRPSFRVQFGNIELYRWLVRIGLMPNKSRIIGAVEVPDEFFRDFLRGHLDGDGSICTYVDRYNTFKKPQYVYTRLWVRFISASRPHIDWLQSRITQLCGVKGHRAQSKVYGNRKASIAVLKFGKKESLRLLRWVYYQPNLPCLERKRTIADRFILASSPGMISSAHG